MRPYVMELSGSDVERVHARMKGAEKWHFSLKIAETAEIHNCLCSAAAEILAERLFMRSLLSKMR